MESATVPESGIDEKSREVRIGLVMYGGVSLAIYINGVAYEFFRAVRGSGIYRLIKALTDSDIVVDVVSGTSAGGINGIMLGYALCNERDFADSATLWREHGDIARLLRSPKSRATATSLLDSENFYQPKLEEVFQYMPPYDPEADEDNSPFSELDLFVTATDVDGTVYTQFDDAGHAIDVKNHRSVFILSHRAGRKEPFRTARDGARDPASSVTIEALAKLSRATSCFPAAFAPVHVSKGSATGDTADDRLQEWGNLGKEAFFLDGGVLDNKPFTYTLKSIFARTADREVDRKLFYIEPDPESIKARTEMRAPTILQAVLAALIGIPGYESIADDLRLLASRNSKLQQYKRLVARFGTSEHAPSAEVQELYTRSRLVALSERILRGIFRNEGRDRMIARADREKAARLVQDFDSRQLGQDVFDLFDVSYRIRRIARVIYLIHDLLYHQGAKALTDEDAQNFRQLWRALNRLFKLYEIIRSAMERLVDEAQIPWETTGKMADVWDTVRAALLRLLDDSEGEERLVREDRVEARFGEEGWLSPSVLSEINLQLRQRSDAIVEEFKSASFHNRPKVDGRSLLPRLDEYERRLIEQFTRAEGPIRHAWDNFANLDAHLFPLEMLGDLQEKDIIETIRISPRDANRGFSQMGLSDKVAGDAVYHFGGFFKRSWRSNDILWGRLDGLCQIVETLLSRERIKAIVDDKAWRGKLQARFFQETDADGKRTFRPALAPQSLFPKAGERTQNNLRLWLTALLSADDSVRAEALQREAFETKLNLMVEAAQLEIVNEDLPKVFEDSILEQTEWNSFKLLEKPTAEEAREEVSKSLRSSPFTFQSPKGRLDPFFATMAVAERTRLAMETFVEERSGPGGGAASPSETRLGKFFKKSYHVGAEQLTRDIPPPILLELLAHTLLVTRNCVINIFPPELGARIRRHPLYFFGLALPLNAFYSAAVLSRRAPAWKIAFWTALPIMCLVALAIAVVWRDPLLVSNGRFHLRNFLILVLVPFVLLLAEFGLLWWLARWARPRAGPSPPAAS
jgi:predicted acylesterase/phospholipase RssA